MSSGRERGEQASAGHRGTPGAARSSTVILPSGGAAALTPEQRALMDRVESSNRSRGADVRTVQATGEPPPAPSAARSSPAPPPDDRREYRSAAAPSSPMPSLPHADRRNTGDGRHRFSLIRALRSRTGGPNDRMDGLEAEVTQELRAAVPNDLPSRIGFGADDRRSVLMPIDLAVDARNVGGYGRPERRSTLTTTTGAGSTSTVAEVPWIAALRNRLLLSRLGVRLVSNATGAYKVPKFAPGASAEWVGETSAPTASAPVMPQLAFTARIASAYIDVTRAFLASAGPAAEQQIIADLTASLAAVLDAGALSGDGVDAPLGLLNDPSVPTVALGTDGAAPSWDALASMSEAIADANGEGDGMAWVTSPAGRRVLQNTPRVTGMPTYLWDEITDAIGSYPAYATTAVPADLTKGSGTGLTALLLGDFTDLQIVQYGPAVEILVDVGTLALQNMVRISAQLLADVRPRHPAESWRKVVDMATS